MEVTFTSSLEAGQRQELLTLFEISFGKALRNDSMLTSMEAVCMVTHPDQGLCGAALLEKTACGIYLSKFAVAPAMRGDGIAKLMWEHLCERYPAFFWRAHRENPFAAWYMRRSEGWCEQEEWCVFWHGLTQDEAEVATEYAVHRPIDFDS